MCLARRIGSFYTAPGFKPKGSIIRGVTILLALLIAGVGQGAGACSDIATVNFRNFIFEAALHNAKYYGSFNGSAPAGPLKLSNGLLLEWDWPNGQVPPEYKNQPDWRTEIVNDVAVKPQGSVGVRVLALSKSHLTGTGWFSYIFAFDCQGGEIRKIFEASGEGVGLARVTPAELVLRVGVWKPEDSHADPSIKITVQYRWSPESQRYVRTTSNAQCPWIP